MAFHRWQLGLLNNALDKARDPLIKMIFSLKLETSNTQGGKPMRKFIVVFLTLGMFLVGSSVAFADSHEEGEANPCNPCNPCNPDGGDGN